VSDTTNPKSKPKSIKVVKEREEKKKKKKTTSPTFPERPCASHLLTLTQPIDQDRRKGEARQAKWKFLQKVMWIGQDEDEALFPLKTCRSHTPRDRQRMHQGELTM